MAFSYAVYEREFVSRTKELRAAYRHGDILKTICYLKYLSSFYYRINLKFADDELEEIMFHTAHRLLGKTVCENCDKNTVLFYDNFGQLYRGLADIYIGALTKLGFYVVWVLYDSLPDVSEIQRKYQGFPNIEFCIIPRTSILDRMFILQQAIRRSNPKHIFIYTKPDDADGLCVMATVTGEPDRYLINLTDHTFWLGKCAADWFIEFRNCGYNISVQYRGISSEKILILPYYPDPRDECSLEGLPFNVEDAFVFSGGSPYKIEGDSAYQDIVEYILEHYPSIKFVYAGNGSNQIIESLKQKFPTQFFHVGERKDLNAVLRRAKFYLSTYPISGGLMIQFAIQNQCVPLSLCLNKGTPSDLNSLMLEPDKADFIFYKKERLLEEIDRIMQDQAYLLSEREKLAGQVISEERFVENLKQLIFEKKTEFLKKHEAMDVEPFLEVYRRNATYELFCTMVYNSRNKWVYRKHPFIVWRQQKKDRDGGHQ